MSREVASLKISPIGEVDLTDVGGFLNRHLNPRISADAWVQALMHPWCDVRPNFGAQLRDGDSLVGVFCAIYSDQIIDGRNERFCNPHSWCVLPEYRKQGVGLVLYLTKQNGYHFAMLTPNPNVAEIFRSLGFKMLDDEVLIIPNLPALAGFSPRRDTVVETDPNRMLGYLSGSVRRDLELHIQIPWLRFVAFGTKSDLCLIAYKLGRWKRLPCARVIYVGDAAAFDRHRRLLQHHLLISRGIATCQVERRFVAQRPPVSLRRRRTQAKQFLSVSLKDSQIRDFYTELVALDV